MMRIAINGFGRIGRNFLRTLLLDTTAQEKMQVVAINIGPAQKESIAHMFMYDTIMGTYPGSVSIEDDYLTIDTTRIRIVAEKDPLKLPWKELSIDWVVEASGRFTKRQDATLHLQAGADKLLITAPAHDDDITIIPGVNDAAYDPANHQIISLGSCTSNALLPMLKVVDEAFGIDQGCMTTVHAYTNTQVLLDVEGEDLRRSRAAALNIIPTSTGSSKMIGKILPHLHNRIQATAIRVPVAIVSLIDLTVTTKKEVTIEALHQAFSAAAQRMPTIIDLCTQPLVSTDFKGNAHSIIIDTQLTSVSGTHMAKLFGWYDNEWAYSTRLKDFLISTQ